MVEHKNSYVSDDGKTRVEIKIKTECLNQLEMKKALSFMAQSSHRFYLELSDKINNTL